MAPALITPEYRLLAELEAAFDQLIEGLEALVSTYAEAPGAAWAMDQEDAGADWLRRALLDFWYQDGQDGRATRSYVGLVAADEALMARVREANAAKADFAA